MILEDELVSWFIGSLVLSLIALGIAFVILVVAAVYVYFAMAWNTIATKLRYKNPWLAWIPFANLSMILQLGKFHWAWVFIILIPFAGWAAIAVLLVISTWRIFEKRKYPGWFSLSMVIPKAGFILYLISI